MKADIKNKIKNPQWILFQKKKKKRERGCTDMALKVPGGHLEVKDPNLLDCDKQLPIHTLSDKSGPLSG